MRRLFSVSMVIGIVLSVLLCAQPAAAAPGTSMSISLDASRVEVGATFDVRAVIQTDVETMAAQCSLSFNPAVLECTGVSVGDFYTPDIVIPSPSDVTIDNVQGTVQFMSVTQFTPVAAKTGTFLIYHFKAKAEGVSSLDLGDVIVNDAGANEIPGITVNNGSLSVGPESVPDLTVTSLSAAFLTDPTYSVSYTVKNQGDASVGAFKMGLYVDGAAQPLVTEEIASLNAGSSYSGTFSGHAVQISGGIDQVKVCADSESVVVESFENNNCKESVIEQTTFTLRLQPSQGCYIEVEVGGEKLPSSQTSAYQVYLGTEVKVTAVVNEGYEFTDWVGDLSGQPNPASITMTQDYTLQAVATELSPPEENDDGGLSAPAIAGIIAAAGLVVAAGAYLAITRLKRNP